MPRKSDEENAELTEKNTNVLPLPKKETEANIEQLNRMLGTVMKYISNDEIEEIDIEYLLETTDGLRDWWNNYRELDRKKVADEIKKSLNKLSLEELEKIREQIQNIE